MHKLRRRRGPLQRKWGEEGVRALFKGKGATLLLLLLLLSQKWRGQVDAAACAGLPAAGRLPCLADLPTCAAGETAADTLPTSSQGRTPYSMQAKAQCTPSSHQHWHQSHWLSSWTCVLRHLSSAALLSFVFCCVHVCVCPHRRLRAVTPPQQWGQCWQQMSRQHSCSGKYPQACQAGNKGRLQTDLQQHVCTAAPAPLARRKHT